MLDNLNTCRRSSHCICNCKINTFRNCLKEHKSVLVVASPNVKLVRAMPAYRRKVTHSELGSKSGSLPCTS